MPIHKALLLPVAALALALAACDRGGTPAQEQATRDSAASVAPAEAVPPASPSGAQTDSAASAAPAPGEASPAAGTPADHGNAAAYDDCMRRASHAHSADERSVLEGTCASSKPR